MTKRIKKAAEILKQGGLVAFPTDTVFGLGASINYPATIKRVFALKKRPRTKPLQILVANLAQAKLLGKFNKTALALAKKNWPGPLTLVVYKTGQVPKVITGKSQKVGLRIPDHPVALKLIKLVGPIAASSANLSGKAPALSAQEVKDSGLKVDYILTGKVKSGKASQVIDTTRGLRILRPG